MNKLLNKSLRILFEFSLFAFGSFLLRTSILYLMADITAYFYSIIYNLSSILIGFMFLAYLMFYLYDVYVKKVNDSQTIITHSVFCFINLVNLIFYFIALDKLVTNFQHGVDTYGQVIVIPLMSVIYLAVSTFYFINATARSNKEIYKSSEMKLLPSIGVVKTIAISISLGWSMYSYYSFFNLLGTSRNINQNPTAYLVLLLNMLIGSIISLYLIFEEKFKEKGMFHWISLGVIISDLLIHIIIMLVYPDFMIQVGKPIAPLDFAGNFKAVNLVLIVIDSLYTVYILIKQLFWTTFINNKNTIQSQKSSAN